MIVAVLLFPVPERYLHFAPKENQKPKTQTRKPQVMSLLFLLFSPKEPQFYLNCNTNGQTIAPSKGSQERRTRSEEPDPDFDSDSQPILCVIHEPGQQKKKTFGSPVPIANWFDF